MLSQMHGSYVERGSDVEPLHRFMQEGDIPTSVCTKPNAGTWYDQIHPSSKVGTRLAAGDAWHAHAASAS